MSAICLQKWGCPIQFPSILCTPLLSFPTTLFPSHSSPSGPVNPARDPDRCELLSGFRRSNCKRFLCILNWNHAFDDSKLTIKHLFVSQLQFCELILYASLQKFCENYWVKSWVFHHHRGYFFLVPGSSGVEDALGDTNPLASPVLRCLLYFVPSDPYLLEILVDDSPPVLTWASRPSPETIKFPMISSSWDPVTFHAWKMSEPPQSSASSNVLFSNLENAVASLTFSFVTLSFQEMPRMLRFHNN